MYNRKIFTGTVGLLVILASFQSIQALGKLEQSGEASSFIDSSTLIAQANPYGRKLGGGSTNTGQNDE